MPRSRSRSAVTGPTPHSASTGSCWRNVSTRSGAITVRPSGFRHADAIFARNLFGATPADAVSDGRRLDLRLQPLRHDLAERLTPRVLGDVEIGLVQRQRLDERRDRTEDVEDLLARRRGTWRSPAGRSRGADRAGPRATSGSPTARRTSAPRSSPPRRRRGLRGGRRRRPACPAASDRRAVRPTRRTRPCRCGGCGGAWP